MVKHEKWLSIIHSFFYYDYEKSDYHTLFSPKYSDVFVLVPVNLIYFVLLHPRMCLQRKWCLNVGRRQLYQEWRQIVRNQPSFSPGGAQRQDSIKVKPVFQGKLALTLAQLRLKPEASRCSTSKTNVFKTEGIQRACKVLEPGTPAVEMHH